MRDCYADAAKGIDPSPIIMTTYLNIDIRVDTTTELGFRPPKPCGTPDKASLAPTFGFYGFSTRCERLRRCEGYQPFANYCDDAINMGPKLIDKITHFLKAPIFQPVFFLQTYLCKKLSL